MCNRRSFAAQAARNSFAAHPFPKLGIDLRAGSFAAAVVLAFFAMNASPANAIPAVANCAPSEYRCTNEKDFDKYECHPTKPSHGCPPGYFHPCPPHTQLLKSGYCDVKTCPTGQVLLGDQCFYQAIQTNQKFNLKKCPDGNYTTDLSKCPATCPDGKLLPPDKICVIGVLPCAQAGPGAVPHPHADYVRWPEPYQSGGVCCPWGFKPILIGLSPMCANGQLPECPDGQMLGQFDHVCKCGDGSPVPPDGKCLNQYVSYSACFTGLKKLPSGQCVCPGTDKPPTGKPGGGISFTCEPAPPPPAPSPDGPCPPGFVKDSAGNCLQMKFGVDCGSGQAPDPVTGKCPLQGVIVKLCPPEGCPAEFTCPPPQNWSTTLGQCLCPGDKPTVGGQCPLAVLVMKKCPDGSFVAGPEDCPHGIVVKQCPDGSFVTEPAECPHGHVVTQCPDGSFVLDAECPKGHVAKQCPDGSFVLDDAPCPPVTAKFSTVPLQLDTIELQCARGYQPDGKGNCIRCRGGQCAGDGVQTLSGCPAGFVKLANNQCCDGNLVTTTGQCCTGGMKPSATKAVCQCPGNAVAIGGKCVTTAPMDQLTIQQLGCTSDKVLVGNVCCFKFAATPDGKTCCLPGLHPGGVGGNQCVCPNGKLPVNGLCPPDRGGSGPTTDKSGVQQLVPGGETVDCGPGMVRGSGGRCVPYDKGSPPNKEILLKKAPPTCGTGQVLLRGTCVNQQQQTRCGRGQTLQNGKCVTTSTTLKTMKTLPATQGQGTQQPIR